VPPKKQSLASGNQVVASNRKARHDFDILETVEAGIVLKGAEVKSLRVGNLTIRDAYAKVERGEMWLHGLHINPYAYAHGFGAVDPDRSRKLLLHADEIGKLGARAALESLTLVPLAVYFKDGRAKVELGLARGRKTHDKRHAIAKRDQEREAARERRWG
jgi:SsrA-binding protein